ncbi:oxidoreductase [Chryseobacterium lactis]|uniref:Oxidoreductase n=1 Tax=Chryseobacterium lactis TaxID=1241981 RepID=A0A3G6RH89_CHRLC|nr:SDR family oxidoreductase [Chryseobacterium lactis]AZA83945.1 SDR family oxidoreductase [Chryseobacterium lactis]AZB04331.1 SDR family oxidoreductase [Chryseobacterium lactis]PNW12502.1 oxidoreductase [Chryseobacterium lactis]
MNLQLKGKKAFISGATQGIGFSIAQQLLEEGASVIINGRNDKKIKQAKKKLQQQFPEGEISAVVADFAQREDAVKLSEELTDIDILINNVGIFGINDFYDVTDEDWYHYFEINVMSGVRLSRQLLPGMIKRNSGRIIFISSESGVNIPENMIHYGVTKAAMSALSNGLSKLTKGTAVTVNTILGGPTYSDGVAETVEQIAKAQNLTVEQMKDIIIQNSNPHILLQRFIHPEEIANLAVYLSSSLSVATNGASLRADSGVLKVI